jgi:hypothetical protein
MLGESRSFLPNDLEDLGKNCMFFQSTQIFGSEDPVFKIPASKIPASKIMDEKENST